MQEPTNQREDDVGHDLTGEGGEGGCCCRDIEGRGRRRHKEQEKSVGVIRQMCRGEGVWEKAGREGGGGCLGTRSPLLGSLTVERVNLEGILANGGG